MGFQRAGGRNYSASRGVSSIKDLREEEGRADGGEGILNATSSSSFPRKRGTGCHLSRPSASFCSLLERTERTREKERSTRRNKYGLAEREREKEEEQERREAMGGREEDQIECSLSSSKEEKKTETDAAKKRSPRSGASGPDADRFSSSPREGEASAEEERKTLCETLPVEEFSYLHFIVLR